MRYEQTDSLTVLLVDDHPLFIEALQMALRPMLRRPKFLLSGSFAEAADLALSALPALVLLDLSLTDAEGVESVGRLRSFLSENAKIIVVSGRDDPATVTMARALGASGFISKSKPLAAIQDDLRIVLDGHFVFPSNIEHSPSAALLDLTPSQARVLSAAATGKLNKQIAFDMGISEPTVKSHMSAVMKKLGVSNRTQAILKSGIPKQLP